MKLLKKIIVIVFIIIIFLFIISNKAIIGYANSLENNEKVICTASIYDDFDDETILVALNHKASMELKQYTISDFPEIECTSVREITESLTQKLHKQLKGKVESNELLINSDTYNRILELKIRNTGKQNIINSIKILEKREEIKAANPNYNVSCQNVIPNDYDCFENEVDPWWIDLVNLTNAWGYTSGANSINVGVIDTGIFTHSDLEENLNFSLSKDFSPYQSGPFVDEVGHGTHVAGIIGAKGNNGYGVAGVCWDVGLVSLKVMNEAKQAITTRICEAITYAAEKNIPILNISLSSDYEIPGWTEALQNYSGLIVCSAGNDNKNIDDYPVYPASYPNENIITVGACDKNGKKWSDSNYGTSCVDIYAPGENILSTYVENEMEYYAYLSGTSMAAPFVSGVAALILSYYPKITTNELKRAIIEFASSYSNNIVLDAARAFDIHIPHEYNIYEICDRDYHYSFCMCGASQKLNHNPNMEGINTHAFTTCIQCNQSLEVHYMRYRSCGTSGHIKTCDCGLTEGSIEKHRHSVSLCTICLVSSEHNYSFKIGEHNNQYHKQYCDCGEYVLSRHAVTSTWTTNGRTFGTCISCNTIVDLGTTIVGPILPFTRSVFFLPEPKNSYISSQGVIILRIEDVEMYLERKFQFD